MNGKLAVEKMLKHYEKEAGVTVLWFAYYPSLLHFWKKPIIWLNKKVLSQKEME